MLLPTPVIVATVVVVLAAAVIAVVVGVAVIEPLESTRGLDLRVARGLDLRVAQTGVRVGGSVIGHDALGVRPRHHSRRPASLKLGGGGPSSSCLASALS